MMYESRRHTVNKMFCHTDMRSRRHTKDEMFIHFIMKFENRKQTVAGNQCQKYL